MTERRGGYKQSREIKCRFTIKNLIPTVEDLEDFNGHYEEAYKVDFETTDLNKLLEGV